MSSNQHLYQPALDLLREMISIPSYSGEEQGTADLIECFLKDRGIKTERKQHNVWCSSSNHSPGAPTILLNSHHDTVKPVGDWTHPPHSPVIENNSLYGLGSNDAGASVVCLTATFLHLCAEPNLPYQLTLALTAEEETSGPNGISSILDEVGPIALAIVGEPTEMQMAVAEKGLVVLDCQAQGKAGHAARDEGDNAIYGALSDIEFIRDYQFEKTSDLLGPVKMTVTQINAGTQHNVVPASCDFVVDVRTNECYSNREVVEFLKKNLRCQVNPRSLRLNSSGLSLHHPVVKKGQQMGLSFFGSPTLSDQSLMEFDSLKIGPGNSSRSHTADEYVTLTEIQQGIETYISLLTDLKLTP